MTRCPDHCPAPSGSFIPSPLAVIAAALLLALKAAWRLACALTYWLSGTEILPRQRRYGRLPHAIARALVLAVGVLALVYGVELAAIVAAWLVSLAGTAEIVARRSRPRVTRIRRTRWRRARRFRAPARDPRPAVAAIAATAAPDPADSGLRWSDLSRPAGRK